MSNGTDRKSMDDVLASIRRIVRAEKEPGAEPATRERSHAAAGGGGGDEPLALTPDMRSDREVEPEAISRPAGTGGFNASIAESPATPDRETLRALVREILVEELTKGEAQGAVRGIIRDELMQGDIGSNISQNVLNLIQAEIAKALENR